MLGRRIASYEQPDRSGHEADDRADPKRRAPSVVDHHVGDERRGETRARANAGEDPAVGNAAFLHWNPARDELVRRGINDSLARTQQKANSNEQPKSARNIG